MKLYKYVVADRVDVLQNGRIRFAQPEHLNDPFDVRPEVEQLLSVARTNAPPGMRAL